MAPTGPFTRLTLAQRDDAGLLYAAGLSYETIAGKFGVSARAIGMTLARAGVRARSRNEPRHTLDERVFDDRSSAARYWAGFIMADGNVCQGSGAKILQMHLHERDRSHVMKFASFIGSSHKITASGGNCVGLSVRSDYLVRRLAEYGIVPNKTFIAEAPGWIASDHDFWRGCIDGDGWISSSNVPSPNNPGRMQIEIGLIGAKTLSHQFAALVRLLGIRSWAKPRQRKPNVWQYQIRDLAAVAMIRYLYGEAEVFLDRKMDRAAKVMNAADHRSVVLRSN